VVKLTPNASGSAAALLSGRPEPADWNLDSFFFLEAPF
jgi:hypothetical protein